MQSFLLVILFSVPSLFAAQASVGPDEPINRILAIKVAGKVDSVIWSIQKSVCLVQLDLPPIRDSEPVPKAPHTQVWLLKADGTSIPQSSKPGTVVISNAGGTTQSVLYDFAASAAADAVAVVISVDGKLFVESLATKPE